MIDFRNKRTCVAFAPTIHPNELCTVLKRYESGKISSQVLSCRTDKLKSSFCFRPPLTAVDRHQRTNALVCPVAAKLSAGMYLRVSACEPPLHCSQAQTGDFCPMLWSEGRTGNREKSTADFFRWSTRPCRPYQMTSKRLIEKVLVFKDPCLLQQVEVAFEHS